MIRFLLILCQIQRNQMKYCSFYFLSRSLKTGTVESQHIIEPQKTEGLFGLFHYPTFAFFAVIRHSRQGCPLLLQCTATNQRKTRIVWSENRKNPQNKKKRQNLQLSSDEHLCCAPPMKKTSISSSLLFTIPLELKVLSH